MVNLPVLNHFGTCFPPDLSSPLDGTLAEDLGCFPFEDPLLVDCPDDWLAVSSLEPDKLK